MRCVRILTLNTKRIVIAAIGTTMIGIACYDLGQKNPKPEPTTSVKEDAKDLVDSLVKHARERQGNESSIRATQESNGSGKN